MTFISNKNGPLLNHEFDFYFHNLNFLFYIVAPSHLTDIIQEEEEEEKEFPFQNYLFSPPLVPLKTEIKEEEEEEDFSLTSPGFTFINVKKPQFTIRNITESCHLPATRKKTEAEKKLCETWLYEIEPAKGKDYFFRAVKSRKIPVFYSQLGITHFHIWKYNGNKKIEGLIHLKLPISRKMLRKLFKCHWIKAVPWFRSTKEITRAFVRYKDPFDFATIGDLD